MPRCALPYAGELKGYFLVGVFRVSFPILTGAIIMPTMLDLAEEDEDSDGNVSWFGLQIKASSILAVLATISSIVVALLAIPFGSMADFTDYRREFLVICDVANGILSLVVGVLIYNGIWRPASLVFLIGAVFFYGGLVAFTSYLPEMSTDEHEVNRLHGTTIMSSILSSAFYTGICFAIGNRVSNGSESSANDPDSIPDVHKDEGKGTETQRATALVGGISGCALQLLAGYCALRYLRRRPAARPPPKGRNPITAGFAQMRCTLREVRNRYPQLRRFLLANMAGSSAVNAWPLISQTLLKTQMDMTNEQLVAIQATSLLTVVTSVLLWVRFARRNSSKTAMLLLFSGVLCVWLVSAASFTDPSRKWVAYPLAAAMGCFFLSSLTLPRSFYCSIVPGLREAEFTGLYFFSIKLLGWVPPALFYAANELSNGHTNLAAATPAVFLLLALALLLGVDVEAARDDVAGAVESRRYAAAEGGCYWGERGGGGGGGGGQQARKREAGLVVVPRDGGDGGREEDEVSLVSIEMREMGGKQPAWSDSVAGASSAAAASGAAAWNQHKRLRADSMELCLLGEEEEGE